MTTTQKKLVYSAMIPLRWSDMDAFGHVNNSVYFTYFEQARIDWWKTVTPPDHSLDDVGPVVINAFCTFLKPIVYPETIQIKLYVGPPGRSSYECYYEIYAQHDPDILYAEGSTKVVWVDRKLGRSIPLPSYMIESLPAK